MANIFYIDNLNSSDRTMARTIIKRVSDTRRIKLPLTHKLATLECMAMFHAYMLGAQTSEDEVIPRLDNETMFTLIEKVVYDVCCVTKNDIYDKKREREKNVFPRFLCFKLSREFMNIGYQKIGDRFSRKNHASVMHGVKCINKTISLFDERNVKEPLYILYENSRRELLKSINNYVDSKRR